MHIQRGVGTSAPNDCFVQALSNAYRLQYSDALEIAQSCGYTPKRGSGPREIIRLWQFLAVPFVAYGDKGNYSRLARRLSYPDLDQRYANPAPQSVSVSTWLKNPENQNGRFMVLVKQHIFAVVHGNILDDFAFSAPDELLARRIQVVARVNTDSIDNLHFLLKGIE